MLEPFAGSQIGEFTVMSPDQDWYVHTLIPEFEKSPEQKNAAASAAYRYAGLLSEAARRAASWIAEKWDIETLREDVETSAENESSVVLYGVIDGRGILLTGDSGVRALTATADMASVLAVSLPNTLTFVQVPHHGSRHNVSSTVLDRIVGPRKAANAGLSTKTSFASAGKDSPTHPRKAVVNAFIRRGATVVATQGTTKRYSHNMPDRPGWVAAKPLAFSDNVETWD